MTERQSKDPVLEVARAVFANNDAVNVATVGGEYSPWILGAYFAQDNEPGHELDLILFLEENGKSMANLKKDPHVAFSISKNDAKEDFVQGRGVIEPADAAAVRAALLKKMPWYQTYTPVTAVRIRTTELFVSSLSRGWFPAKRLAPGEA